MDPAGILLERGYSLIKQIGKGAFGTCYTVLSEKYSVEFVCKVIEVPEDERANYVASSFENEVRALSSLGHSNIMKIYDFFSKGNFLFLILDYCKGGSLLDRIRESGRVARCDLVPYCKQILDALCFCHSQGYAHHDIKPGNLLIDAFGRIQLADFGLANITEKNIQSKRCIGSMPYMAPELLMRCKYDPFKADVWALGVTLYQMASGRLPWYAQSPKQLLIEIQYGMEPISEILREISTVIEMCLVPEEAKRATVFELSQYLDSLKKARTIRKFHSLDSFSSLRKRQAFSGRLNLCESGHLKTSSNLLLP